MAAESQKISEDKIRPKELFSEFIRLSEVDAETFFYEDDFTEIDCPACKSSKVKRQFVKNTFSYVECDTCKSLYVNRRPDSNALNRYYAQSKSQEFWADVILKTTGRARKESIIDHNITQIKSILDEYAKVPKNVLDIGAGSGGFLKEMKANFPEILLAAVEPGGQCPELQNIEYQLYPSLLEDIDEGDIKPSELTVSFEVIEHAQDPISFVQKVYDFTKDDGIAILSGLCVSGFDIQLMWNKSKAIQPPYHLNFFSVDGFQKLFKNAGFSKVDVVTPGRLDVEIVKNAIESGWDIPLGEFESNIINGSDVLKMSFQQWLRDNKLSSHAWIIAQK